jgi:hypothetical protein
VGDRIAIAHEEASIGETIGEMEEDRVRLGEGASVLGREDRSASLGTGREEVRGPRLSVKDVDLDPFVGEFEPVKHPAELPAVAGCVEVVEPEHAMPLDRTRGSGQNGFVARRPDEQRSSQS